jgi:hypothetical protein
MAELTADGTHDGHSSWRKQSSRRTELTADGLMADRAHGGGGARDGRSSWRWQSPLWKEPMADGAHGGGRARDGRSSWR